MHQDNYRLELTDEFKPMNMDIECISHGVYVPRVAVGFDVEWRDAASIEWYAIWYTAQTQFRESIRVVKGGLATIHDLLTTRARVGDEAGAKFVDLVDVKGLCFRIFAKKTGGTEGALVCLTADKIL